jgi:hypothetical protein
MLAVGVADHLALAVAEDQAVAVLMVEQEL